MSRLYSANELTTYDYGTKYAARQTWLGISHLEVTRQESTLRINGTGLGVAEEVGGEACRTHPAVAVRFESGSLSDAVGLRERDPDAPDRPIEVP
jgi:hypothetical protein